MDSQGSVSKISDGLVVMLLIISGFMIAVTLAFGSILILQLMSACFNIVIFADVFISDIIIYPV